MPEPHVFDLLPGYALGNLDDRELIEVSRHLPHCQECQKELAGFRSTADRLILSARLLDPSQGLKARVVARVEQAANLKAHVEHPTQVLAHKPRPMDKSRKKDNLIAQWLNRQLPQVAIIALITLVVFLSVSSLYLWYRIGALESRVPQDRVIIVRLEGVEQAANTQGYLVLFPGEPYGTLVVHDAPELDEAQQYQLWLIRDGKRTNGGVFSVDEHGYGTLVIDSMLPLDEYQSFGVTIEPAGGSPGPTGKKVLGGDL